MPLKTTNQSQTSNAIKKTRRPRRTRKGNMTYRMASNALRLAKAANYKELKRMENVESSAVTSANYNGAILNVTDNIIQGLTDSERVGDNLFAKNLIIRGHANFNSAAAASIEAQVLRIICYYDKSNKINIVGPGVGGYLSVVGNSAAVDSMKYWDSRFETNLIFDKTMTLTRSGNDAQIFRFKANVNKPVQYNNASNTVTRGAIKFIVLSDQDPILPLPEWSFYYRLTYVDS